MPDAKGPLSDSTARLLATATGASACFALRVIGVWQQWNLPRVTAGS